MNIKNWTVTAKGNPPIEVVARGVEYRVVLFRYKQAPNEWGYLFFNILSNQTTFGKRRYASEIAAHDGPWKALCAI
jgi:hypothetical protein